MVSYNVHVFIVNDSVYKQENKKMQHCLCKHFPKIYGTGFEHVLKKSTEAS